jgi:CheY-like chemotaxis protein
MSNSPSRILVAEDNAINARLIVAMLEREGHEVTVVADGGKAVAISRVEDFDVILMDVNMPEMGGLEATRQIRSGAAPMRDVTIIALTADDDGATQRDCIEAGMNAFLTKPISMAELFKILSPRSARDKRA